MENSEHICIDWIEESGCVLVTFPPYEVSEQIGSHGEEWKACDLETEQSGLFLNPTFVEEEKVRIKNVLASLREADWYIIERDIDSLTDRPSFVVQNRSTDKLAAKYFVWGALLGQFPTREYTF